MNYYYNGYLSFSFNSISIQFNLFKVQIHNVLAPEVLYKDKAQELWRRGWVSAEPGMMIEPPTHPHTRKAD